VHNSPLQIEDFVESNDVHSIFTLGRRRRSVIQKVWVALLAIGLTIWSFSFVFVLVGFVIGLVKYHHWGWNYFIALLGCAYMSRTMFQSFQRRLRKSMAQTDRQ
jgi:hypothetical protein